MFPFRKCAQFTVLALSLLTVFSSLPVSAQEFSGPSAPLSVNVIYRFMPDGITKSGYSHGDLVYDELIQGADGNFYGTTVQGGSGLCANGFGIIGCGTVFKLTPAGVQTVLFNFDLDSNGTTATNGIYPYGGLVQGPDGNFYGTTTGGGNSQAVCNGTLGCGVVFRITPAGKFTVLHTFQGALANPADGGVPTGRLILGRDGKFYGTTYSGGNAQAFYNQGTIFSITMAGAYTFLYTFDNIHGVTDGVNPYAGLIQGQDGALYGTTEFGGSSGVGTVYRFAGGKTTVLHSFPVQPVEYYPDGAFPYAALVQASDGNFYGTTSAGGSLSSAAQAGTIFRITKTGVFTKLWDFNGNNIGVNGDIAYGAMIQASDGNLYGTTLEGGAANAGTVFQMTLGGTLTQLLDFDMQTDGAYPRSVPLQDSDGTLYITTSTTINGTDQGDVVQIANGLPAPAPAITLFSPASGKVGAKVTILGKNFLGTSSVAFNGIPAAFQVRSTTVLVTQVPSGATTGPITITNAGGSGVSKTNFTVLP